MQAALVQVVLETKFLSLYCTIIAWEEFAASRDPKSDGKEADKNTQNYLMHNTIKILKLHNSAKYCQFRASGLRTPLISSYPSLTDLLLNSTNK